MDEQTILRVKNGLSSSAIGPETIALMLTDTCNLRCRYCRGGRPGATYARSVDGTVDELSTQELFLLFEHARELGVKEINLGGMVGEPFCRKDIFDILGRIKQNGLIGSMTTNGSLLDREAARYLTACDWDLLLLSFDSNDRDVQQTLRPAANGKPYFERVIEFLESLGQFKSKLRVLLNVVITRLNYQKFPELVAFANQYQNIESINVLKLLNTGIDGYDALQLNELEQKEFRLILSSLRHEKKLLYLSNWLDAEPSKIEASSNNVAGQVTPTVRTVDKCFTNYYILSIDSNGDVLQCPQHPVTIAGLNIRKTTLKALWGGEHLLFRERLARHAPCFGGCCTILKEQNKMIMSGL